MIRLVYPEGRRPCVRLLFPGSLPALTLLLAAPVAVADPPAGYYDSVNPASAETLRTTLHEVIDDHTRVRYTSSTQVDTWDVLKRADEFPEDDDRILDVYKNAGYPKAEGGNDNYNREHAWPKSYGFRRDNAGNYPFTDCHHLFLSDSVYNSARGNRPYRACDPDCTERATETNAGVGGVVDADFPGTSNWTTSDRWQTWQARKGDVARALFYMDVRYQGGSHGVTDHPEPDLILTDDPTLIVSSSQNQDVGHMGRLSVLLEWHRDDPVDDRERHRNDVVFEFQGNRNPFIDHPEWVSCLFEDECEPPPGEEDEDGEEDGEEALEELQRRLLERLEAIERELEEVRTMVESLNEEEP